MVHGAKCTYDVSSRPFGACGELSRQFRVILLKLQLVAKLGEKKVREALDPLITKCKLAMRGECDPSYSSSEMNGGSVFR